MLINGNCIAFGKRRVPQVPLFTILYIDGHVCGHTLLFGNFRSRTATLLTRLDKMYCCVDPISLPDIWGLSRLIHRNHFSFCDRLVSTILSITFYIDGQFIGHTQLFWTQRSLPITFSGCGFYYFAPGNVEVVKSNCSGYLASLRLLFRVNAWMR